MHVNLDVYICAQQRTPREVYSMHVPRNVYDRSTLEQTSSNNICIQDPNI